LLTPEQVEERFRERGEMHEGALCLRPHYAVECVKTCERNDLAVIGVDTFLESQGRMVPQLHLVADFSSMSAADWAAFRGLCNRESERFLAGLPEQAGLMVTLSIAPAGAWGTL
jgi:hypothetical protein